MGLVIGGRTIAGPKKTLLVIPREEGDIVFKFVAVLDRDEFDLLYPLPKPPNQIIPAQGGKVPNLTDPNFLKAIEERDAAASAWFFLKSIEPSEIKWQQVNMADPKTYVLWRQELKEAGFSVKEVDIIFDKFLETNIITDVMLKEAKERFLAQAQGT